MTAVRSRTLRRAAGRWLAARAKSRTAGRDLTVVQRVPVWTPLGTQGVEDQQAWADGGVGMFEAAQAHASGAADAVEASADDVEGVLDGHEIPEPS